ncbi:hypothetical protein HDU76_004076 [Blyttiomyces sp. JEL0837]|nr:hypothetical protein HDU76_004076 [Blyttiomyces sp. JEL0837]
MSFDDGSRHFPFIYNERDPEVVARRADEDSGSGKMEEDHNDQGLSSSLKGSFGRLSQRIVERESSQCTIQNVNKVEQQCHDHESHYFAMIPSNDGTISNNMSSNYCNENPLDSDNPHGINTFDINLVSEHSNIVYNPGSTHLLPHTYEPNFKIQLQTLPTPQLTDLVVPPPRDIELYQNHPIAKLSSTDNSITYTFNGGIGPSGASSTTSTDASSDGLTELSTIQTSMIPDFSIHSQKAIKNAGVSLVTSAVNVLASTSRTNTNTDTNKSPSTNKIDNININSKLETANMVLQNAGTSAILGLTGSIITETIISPYLTTTFSNPSSSSSTSLSSSILPFSLSIPITSTYPTTSISSISNTISSGITGSTYTYIIYGNSYLTAKSAFETGISVGLQASTGINSLQYRCLDLVANDGFSVNFGNRFGDGIVDTGSRKRGYNRNLGRKLMLSKSRQMQLNVIVFEGTPISVGMNFTDFERLEVDKKTSNRDNDEMVTYRTKGYETGKQISAFGINLSVGFGNNFEETIMNLVYVDESSQMMNEESWKRENIGQVGVTLNVGNLSGRCSLPAVKSRVVGVVKSSNKDGGLLDVTEYHGLEYLSDVSVRHSDSVQKLVEASGILKEHFKRGRVTYKVPFCIEGI